ncbi:trehalase family glycosidase [Pedobacter sp. MC2016-15]|uniref:MGH1-like glycoside hydrolase domain-containing protein n=1 Tax=Pedobacter sp. MC2016-15 TaxID=2994473 RepID=UPI002246CAA5|nr:trehalase family glycosidase [Pedobacter sp. MC2016-15]MCX2477774.1 trehalase family glycosidase [Pedobacter sp. MC2016-15]
MKTLFLSIIIAGFLSGIAQAQIYVNTYVPDSLVFRNTFLNQKPNPAKTPTFSEIKEKLPEPIWPKRSDVVSCYWKAWSLAFRNVHPVTKENGFIEPYIDPAFNKHIFMWDTSFMVLFGRYGHNAFNFQGSLDNFYNKQHKDGFICREISTLDGNELFERFDASSTGPNIMPWAEWEYFQNFNDQTRLKKVFAPLLAYYKWFRTNRSWPDGSYFSTGWGCGMDNQPRVPEGFHNEFSHAFMSWIDTSMQELFAGKVLIAIAKTLGRENEIKEIEVEIQQLSEYVNTKMWDQQTSFYYDRFRDGSLSNVKSIASYWALLAEAIPNNKLKNFIGHLENPREFARLHRVPTLSADHPVFTPGGNYWQGGVWAPTSYMVLRGLTKYKQDSLAYEIALNHLDNVVKVFNKTGTLWENYAPDRVEGKYQKDLVGWTGLVPISVLFEYVFGIRPNVPANTVVWDVRLLDEFGVNKYPYKEKGLINFWVARRKRSTDQPEIKVQSNIAFDLQLVWKGGTRLFHIKPGRL